MKGANFHYLIADDSFYSNMVLLNNDKIQLPWLDALQIYLLMINIKSLSKSQSVENLLNLYFVCSVVIAVVFGENTKHKPVLIFTYLSILPRAFSHLSDHLL